MYGNLAILPAALGDLLSFVEPRPLVIRIENDTSDADDLERRRTRLAKHERQVQLEEEGQEL